MGQIEKINKNIVGFYIKSIEDLHYDTLQKESVKYALETILSETEKFLILVVLYVCIGKIIPFITILLVVCPLRMLAGGIHMKSFITCLLVSGVYFTFIIYASGYFDVGKIAYVTAFLIIMTIAPVQTKNHLESTKGECRKQKLEAIGVVMIAYVLFELILTQMTIYVRFGLCVFQVELVVAKVISEGRMRS